MRGEEEEEEAAPEVGEKWSAKLYFCHAPTSARETDVASGAVERK